MTSLHALEGLDRVWIGLATVEDAGAVARMAESFFLTTTYVDRGLVPDVVKYQKWIESVVHSGSNPHILAKIDGTLIAFLSFGYDETFATEPCAVMNVIYVEPAYRRSALARVLLALAQDVAKSEGAVAFHVPVATVRPETKGLFNTLRKAGFDPVGYIMGRRL